MEGASHANGSSTVRLADGRQVRGSLVLDATGHLRKLVEYDKEFNPGFQGAYGIIAGGQGDWGTGRLWVWWHPGAWGHGNRSFSVCLTYLGYP